jgi:protein-S-isoprenylcysteine O-methyltransferase Ste14
MNDIDQKIQAALRSDPAGDALASEPNLAEEVISTFRGRRRWISAGAVVMNLVFLVGAAWATVRFLGAESSVAQLRWCALAFVFVLVVMYIKLWFWLEMHTNRMLRELKRIELLMVTRQEGAKVKASAS